jgi:hypothetical protein
MCVQVYCRNANKDFFLCSFFFGDCGHMVRTMVETRPAVCWDNRLILVFAIHSTVFLISMFFG